MKREPGMPTAAKAGILGGAMLLLLIAGWFLIISPKRHEAAKISAQIEDTRTQIAALQSGAPKTNVQPIRVADLFKLSRAMPDRADIPSVLLQLSQISAETGVSFQSITPHDPVPNGSYLQIGIDLVFQGHFYDLSDFLYRLRNLVGVHQGVLAATGRLFSVDKIQFDEGELKFPQVKATLTVSAYVFGDGTFTSAPTITTTPTTATDAEPPPAATPTPGTVPGATPSDAGTTPIPAAPPGATAAGAPK